MSMDFFHIPMQIFLHFRFFPYPYLHPDEQMLNVKSIDLSKYEYFIFIAKYLPFQISGFL